MITLNSKFLCNNWVMGYSHLTGLSVKYVELATLVQLPVPASTKLHFKDHK